MSTPFPVPRLPDDVDPDMLVDGDVPAWDTTARRFVPQPQTGGGGGGGSLDATGQPSGHVPTAQGDDTWEWAAQTGGGGGGGAVDSVNGKTGAVVLGAGDVGAAPASHNHAASDITSGTLAIGRIPTGTTGSTVALGNHTHTPAEIGAATSAQGALAATAVQPGDDAATLGSDAAAAGTVLTADGAGGSSWEEAGGGGGNLYAPKAAIFPTTVDAEIWSALAPAAVEPLPVGTGHASRLSLGMISIDACTLSSVAVNVTTSAATATLRVGIYAANADGTPGARLYDSGNLDASTTGLRSAAATLALPAGVYWVALGLSVDSCRVDGWQPLPAVNAPRRWRTPSGTSWAAGLPSSITVDPTNSSFAGSPMIYVKAALA